MQVTLRAVHLLSLALWFGSITFFSFFTALPVIGRMQKLAEEKPVWLTGLEDKKQGTRLAGEALAPVFDRYFWLQVICGVVALGTALAWVNLPGKVHKLRAILLAGALVLALANTLWLAPRVHELRNLRYSELTQVAQQAETDFGHWHTYSLVTDLATLLLVTVALCTAAALPNRVSTALP